MAGSVPKYPNGFIKLFHISIFISIFISKTCQPETVILYYDSSIHPENKTLEVVEFAKTYLNINFTILTHNSVINSLQNNDGTLPDKNVIMDNKNINIVNVITNFQEISNSQDKNNGEIAAVIGPALDYQMLPFIAFPHQAKIPVISYAAKTSIDPLLSAPGFYRVIYSLHTNTRALISLCKHFDWKTVGLIQCVQKIWSVYRQAIVLSFCRNLPRHTWGKS